MNAVSGCRLLSSASFILRQNNLNPNCLFKKFMVNCPSGQRLVKLSTGTTLTGSTAISGTSLSSFAKVYRFRPLATSFHKNYSSGSSRNIDVEKHWNHFKVTHGKAYDAQEDLHRREIFEANLFKILNHNIEADLGTHTYRLGINQFADLTQEEVSQRYKGFKRGQLLSKPNHDFTSNLSSADLPESRDWRTEGLVTPVKNQGQCGACWAFSTTGSLEGMHAKATGKLVSLSEQNLIDCSKPEGNLGCGGGVMQYAFEYILRNRGIDTESSYPYEAKDGVCRFKRCKVGATIKGYVDIPFGDELALQYAVSKVGPVSVALDASLETFNFYSGGVYNDQQCSSTVLDHAGTLIGYGTDENTGQDYWLVKNSWGEAWGEKGYVRIARNASNLCGIATQACYPIV